MSLGLSGKQIFLTGASGFIGARIAECLTSAYGVEVHALVRRFGTVGVARLARLAGVRLFEGDIRDMEAVNRAAAGCTHVIHCAISSTESTRQQQDVAIGGTRNVLEAAIRVGAERVLYFSSCAVHGPALDGPPVQEEAPLRGNFFYARLKIQVEALIAQYQRIHQVPVVILRPTCVWGPFSPTWTIAPAELIKQGIPFVPFAGKGAANAVYIDNVVDGVWLALTVPEAAGHSFLMNDDYPATWGELYEGYARCLGVPLRYVEHQPGAARMVGVSLYNAGVVLRDTLTGKTSVGLGTLREVYEHVPVARQAVGALPDWMKQRLRQYRAERTVALPSSNSATSARSDFLEYASLDRPTLELYGAKGRYSNRKAKELLGWRSRVSFEEAMRHTGQWLAYAGYTSSAPSMVMN